MAGYRGGQVKVNAAGLAGAITASLQNYTVEVSEKIIQNASDIADEAVQMLKDTSPQSTSKTKHYARQWKKKQVHFKVAKAVRFKVYNTKYQLTHLLEKPHATRNGGRTQAQPHIYAVETWAREEMLKRTEEAVKSDN